MRIKATRSICGSYGMLAEGGEAVVSDATGKALVEAGLAVEVSEDQPEEKKVDFGKSTVKVKGK